MEWLQTCMAIIIEHVAYYIADTTFSGVTSIFGVITRSFTRIISRSFHAFWLVWDRPIAWLGIGLRVVNFRVLFDSLHISYIQG